MIDLNTIYNENCLETMSKIDDNFVDLIVTSPPYNKGYWSSNRNVNNGFKTKSRRIEYDNFNDNLKPEEYIKIQKKNYRRMFKNFKANWLFIL